MRLVFRTIAILLGVAGLLLSPVLGGMALNKFRRMQLVAQLSSLPLPKNARVIAKGSSTGNIGPWNSDNCGYEAVLVFEAWLKESEGEVLRTRLESTELASPVSGGRPIKLEVHRNQNVYTLVALAGPYEPNTDPRCW